MLALGLLLAAPVAAQLPATGFLDRVIEDHGTRHRYQVYVPPDYSPTRRWPVILFLHGAGERGVDGLRPTHTGLAGVIRWQRDWFPAVVVFPQVAWPDSFWAGAALRIALRALDATVAEFHGDSDRVYLTGLSMGAYGAWRATAEHPARFAAVTLAAGGLPDPLPTGAPIGVPDPYAYVANRVREVPLWVFHGDADTLTLTDTRRLVAALRWVGAAVRYTEYAGAGHDASWQRAYADPELWSWLFAQRRARR